MDFIQKGQGRIKEAWGPGANGECGAPVPRVFVTFREIIPTGRCQKRSPIKGPLRRLTVCHEKVNKTCILIHIIATWYIFE